MRCRGVDFDENNSELSSHGATGSLGPKVPSTSLDHGYEASEEGSVDDLPELVVKIYPLVQMSVVQPHFLTTCTNSAQKMEVSCFDASVNLSPHNYFITCGGHRLPLPLDYQHPLFQTKPGEPDKKSGVPPALLTLKVSDFLLGEGAGVSLSVDRPVKFNLSSALYFQSVDVMTTLMESMCLEDLVNLVKLNSQPKQESNASEDSTWRTSLCCLKSVSLSSKQVVVKFPTQQHFNPKSKELYAELSASVSKLVLDCSLTSRQAEPKMVQSATGQASVEGALVKTTVGIYAHKLVGPWTFNVTSDADWSESPEGSPNVSLRVQSNLLHVEIGPNHLLAIDHLRDHVHAQFPHLFDTAQTSPVAASEDKLSSPVTCSSEQHYTDDLRAGAFQYVDASPALIVPKSYQVDMSTQTQGKWIKSSRIFP